MRFGLFLAAALFVSACGSKDRTRDEELVLRGKTFDVVPQWIEGPASETYCKARLTFQPAKSVTDIIFDPQMPTMHHGTSTIDQKISQEGDTPNVQVVEGIWFTMGGEWEIGITATVDGTTDKVIWKVRVP